MEELKVEQTDALTAQPAEAEMTDGAQGEQVSYGKFKDAAALLKAYNSLQSEFTKRCQRIKELEEAASVDKANAPTHTVENGSESITPADKEKILKGYLKELLETKTKAIVMDGEGVGIKTPSHRPSTVEAAGKLAKEIFCR